MWPFVLKSLCVRVGEGSSGPASLILTLWVPDFKETWGVGVQISHYGTEKSKRTAWRRWQFKPSLRRQEKLSRAEKKGYLSNVWSNTSLVRSVSRECSLCLGFHCMEKAMWQR